MHEDSILESVALRGDEAEEELENKSGTAGVQIAQTLVFGANIRVTAGTGCSSPRSLLLHVSFRRFSLGTTPVA